MTDRRWLNFRTYLRQPRLWPQKLTYPWRNRQYLLARRRYRRGGLRAVHRAPEPEWLRLARAEVEAPQAETRPGRAWERVLCPRGIHGPRFWQEHKFNGGNTCWLCPFCRRIIRYDR